MYYIAVFLLLGASICIEGRRLPQSSLASEVAADACDGKLFSCANCTFSRICRPQDNGDLVSYVDSQCPQERSWCDPQSGSCVEKQPPSCGKEDSTFVCLQKNSYFPATDCHQFHYCDDKYMAKLFSCKEDKVFNPLTVNCDNSVCGKYTCANTAEKAPHEHFVQYYAMCDQKSANAPCDPLVLNYCPEYFSLNSTSQQCEPDCQTHFQFNIPDPTDCHSYYHCKKECFLEQRCVNYPTKLQCPSGQGYDPKKFMCADESTIDSCQT